MRDYQLKKPFAAAVASAAILTSALASTGSASASTNQLPSALVASDGAVTTNAAWEAHTSSTWYIELQRIGTDYIEAGIGNENPAQISQGLKILDWGWAHQGADGSFPGTGSGTGKIGGMFHTTSLFFEAASRAVIDLQNYSPATYDMPADFYADKIAAYKADIALTGQWLTTPSILTAGQSFNQPYTHRRYVLGAGLQEAAVVTGNAQFSAIASAFITDGLSRQLGTGWTAAITQNADGSIPPATLVAPGGANPDGTVATISAEGVNPERGGYDISYHMVGCLYASRWYASATDPILKAQVKNMLVSALQWERSRMSVQGVVDPTGSTRIGVDETQDGAGVKTFAVTEAIGAFTLGSQVDRKGRDFLAAIRIAEANTAPTADTISATGAVNVNALYEAGLVPKYNVGCQADGATFIRIGIHREDESLIQEGLAILDWGWAHQAADGSFPGTSSIYNDPATFLEAAAQSVLALQQYQPISHRLHGKGYSDEINSYISKIALTGTYLQGPLITQHYASFWSASRLMTYAAGFQEAAVITGNSSFSDTGTTFLNDALAMQLPDGTNPENGLFAGNAQATGALETANYLAVSSDASLQARLIAYLDKSMVKEMSVVSVTGHISGSSPAVATISRAFVTAYQITSDPLFQAEYNRINVVSL